MYNNFLALSNLVKHLESFLNDPSLKDFLMKVREGSKLAKERMSAITQVRILNCFKMIM